MRSTSTVLNMKHKAFEVRPGTLVLADIKRARGVVKKNAGASLVDVGDGVLCCEFHSKMNSIGEDIVSMLYAGLEETQKNFEAMIIANEGENFSVGANLVLSPAGRARGRMGRAERSGESLAAGQHGPQVCRQARGFGAVRTNSRRRLRNRAAYDSASFGRTLHGAGGTRSWA